MIIREGPKAAFRNMKRFAHFKVSLNSVLFRVFRG